MEAKEYGNPLEKEAYSGVFCLLYDMEIDGATQEQFFHLAEKFLSPSGVEVNSRLSFIFDPSYQKLVIHKIVIHRGDQILDQFEPRQNPVDSTGEGFGSPDLQWSEDSHVVFGGCPGR